MPPSLLIQPPVSDWSVDQEWGSVVFAERQRQAVRELARRELSRRDFLSFTSMFTPDYSVGWIHTEVAAYLDAFLEACERNERPRLMVFLPPRHGKSQLVSRCFAPYILGRHPKWEVVLATYNQEMASILGRDVRGILNDPLYADLFPSVAIAKDSNAMDHVRTTDKGSFSAVGVGSSLTGRGAKILLIDDPVKDRETADSEVERRKTWDWYSSTARTRLAPGGGIIILQCMVGGTRVRRPDGSETPLRDIRPGDQVATCDNGTLSTATVRNWANQGPDDILAVRLSSGTILRANERHPFLVWRKGEPQWVKVRNLVPGEHLLRVRDTATGGGLSAPARDAENQLAPRDSALRITQPGGSPSDSVRLAATPAATETRTSNTGMASPSSTSTPSALLREGSVPCVGEPPPRGLLLTGKAAYASTTAMTLAGSADFSVTTAISSSGAGLPLNASFEQWSICDFTPDQIVEIVSDGREDVFDLEVERTENFIANGCVSHNTRWHQDDLAGMLLAKAKESKFADQWHVYSYPAVATQDEPNRTKGEALDDKRWPLEELASLRGSMSPRDWTALYQQNPVPDDGNFFKKDWVKTFKRKELPSNVYWYVSTDFAIGQNQTNDWTVLTPFAVDSDHNIYVCKPVRKRIDAYEIVEELLDLIEEHSPMYVAIERGHISKSIGPHLKARSAERRMYGYTIWSHTPHRDKTSRARSFQGRMQQGKIFFEASDDFEEYLQGEVLAFPAGRWDDFVDTCSLGCLMLEDIVAPAPGPGLPNIDDEIVAGSMEDLERRMPDVRNDNPHRPVSLFAHLKKRRKA